MIRCFNGDLKTSGNTFLYGDEEIAQAVKNRLFLFLGEYFLNTSEGTPWFEAILGRKDQSIAGLILRQRIISTNGVAGMLTFNLVEDKTARQTTVTTSIRTVNGGIIEIEDSI